MPDSLGTSSTTTTTAAPTTAIMTWTTTAAPPKVFLSFEGIDQPIGLFGDLAAIGWTVPTPPSRPSNAIEWVPDPVAGTEYTIRPWRVRQMELERNDWSDEVAKAIGALTYETLQRHGVPITGTPAMLEKLAGPSTPQPAAASASAGTLPVPTAPPLLVLISYLGETIEGLRHAEASTNGRKRTIVSWTESQLELGALGVDGQARVTLMENSSDAWTVSYPQSPTTASNSGQATLCAVLPNTEPDDKKLLKFVSMLGPNVTVASLTSLDQRDSTTGALLLGPVPASNYEMITSNVRLGFRNAIVRSEVL